MILNRYKPNENTADENCFICTDDASEETLGRCTIYPVINEGLFPHRPLRLLIELSDISQEHSYVQDALLGAAIARTRRLAEEHSMPARAFLRMEDGNDELMTSLEIMGFEDDDAFVRMKCRLYDIARPSTPSACVLVEDTLDSPLEQKYFLDRYNEIFVEENNLDWVRALRNCNDFRRMLFVSKLGMIGEIVYRIDDDGCGELLWLYTVSKWRHKGIATKLLRLACADLHERGVGSLKADIQLGIPYLPAILEKQGFAPVETLYRYPGLDIDPVKPKKTK